MIICYAQQLIYWFLVSFCMYRCLKGLTLTSRCATLSMQHNFPHTCGLTYSVRALHKDYFYLTCYHLSSPALSIWMQTLFCCVLLPMYGVSLRGTNNANKIVCLFNYYLIVFKIIRTAKLISLVRKRAVPSASLTQIGS